MITLLAAYAAGCIVHQTGSAQLIDKYANSISEWKRLHPECKYILWEDSDIDLLLSNVNTTEFPHLKRELHRIPHDSRIIKIDVVRYYILYMYGGLYSDLDIIPQMSYTDLINSNKTFVPKTDIGFSNDLLIGQKGSSFYKQLVANFKVRRIKPRYLSVLLSAGPLYLTIQRHLYKGQIATFLDSEYRGHIPGQSWLTPTEIVLVNFYYKIVTEYNKKF